MPFLRQTMPFLRLIMQHRDYRDYRDYSTPLPPPHPRAGTREEVAAAAPAVAAALSNREVWALVDKYGKDFRLSDDTFYGQLSQFVLAYNVAWVDEALQRSVLAGKCELRYVNGILVRWKGAGGPENDRGNGH